MKITHLDHLVLTVINIPKTITFYESLGMEVRYFADNRVALHFGLQKINLHQIDNTFEPKAKYPQVGSADLCFVVDGNITQVITLLTAQNIPIELGPIQRTGAQGTIMSIYCRDPSDNLIELSSYI